MSEQEAVTAVSDAELVTELRAGDRRAMGELYARHHADAVRVGHLVQPAGDGEGLAAEAFARVFAKIVDGGGPTDNFRAYLHTVIRNLNVERIRQADREHPASDRPWLLDTATDGDAAEVDDVDAEHAARALQALPENWRQLLWRLEVQGRKPAEVAAELSVPVATISDTAYRAREGLRLAYLDQHLPTARSSHCRWTRDRLSRLARGGLSARATTKARHHLDRCVECAALYDELEQLNTRLGAAIWPIVLVGGVVIGGVGGSSSSGRSDPPGRSGLRGSSRGIRRSRVFSAAATAPAAVVIVVVATLVAGVAAAGLWLSRDGVQANRADQRQAGQDSVPSQARPSPADDSPLDDDARSLVDGDTGPLLPLPGTTRGPGVAPAPPAATQPGRPPGPAPGPGPELPEEPSPVDLEVGAPTVAAHEQQDHWRLTVPVNATGGTASNSFTIDLTLTLNDIAGFVERQPAEWDCGPIQDGDSNGDPYFFDTVTCQYRYQPGQSVAPLRLVLHSASAPSGAVTVSSDGNADPDTSDNYREF